MPYYVATTVTNDVKGNPAGVIGEFQRLDLGATGFILFSPGTQTDPGYTFICNLETDPCGASFALFLLNAGVVGVTAVTTLQNAIISLMSNPPTGKWTGIIPALSGLKELHFGGINVTL